MSEKQYLKSIGEKVVLYNEAKEKAIQWLIENQIKDKDKIQNALIMSQIWIAHNLGHEITMSDLLIYLGDNTDIVDTDTRIVQLDKEFVALSLEQMLEASVL